MINENNYGGAVEKLTNDLLKKLDADENADWVKQQVLVSEIKALIGIINYGVSA